MAYCPRCGREQRCGCEKCHICGVELVERPPSSTRGPRGAESAGAGTGAPGPHEGRPLAREDHREPEERAGPVSRSVQAAMLVLGCGILLITLVEAVNRAAGLPAAGGTATAADALEHAAYYLATLLYSSSVRLLTGFALVIAALVWEPNWPIADARAGRRVNRGLALVMGALSLLCFLAAVLLLLPGGSSNLALRSLVPSTWATVCIMVALGASLAGGGLVLARHTGIFTPARLPAGGGGSRSGTGDLGVGSVAGTPTDAVKSYDDRGQGSGGNIQ